MARAARGETAVRGRALYRLYIGIADGVSIGEAVISSTGTPIPAQWTRRRRCRDRQAAKWLVPLVETQPYAGGMLAFAQHMANDAAAEDTARRAPACLPTSAVPTRAPTPHGRRRRRRTRHARP